jgi:hypothetical protein
MSGGKSSTAPMPTVNWMIGTSKPPVCAGCGCDILPMGFRRDEAPATHMKFVGNKGPYHLGCEPQP